MLTNKPVLMPGGNEQNSANRPGRLWHYTRLSHIAIGYPVRRGLLINWGYAFGNFRLNDGI